MPNQPSSPLNLNSHEFKEMGYQLVNTIAELFDAMPTRPLSTKSSTHDIRLELKDFSIDNTSVNPAELLKKTTDLLTQYSLFNGHPKFMGFITSSPAPIGVLGDLLASAINSNVSAQILSPIATEIEKQTITWLAELIGLPSSYGGLLVSGGNMANFTGFLAARTAKMPKSFKDDGLSNNLTKYTIYCSKKTHTWIEKAVILFGHGLNSIRWIATNTDNQMDCAQLEKAIKTDLSQGHCPFMVVGTAGDVSTGAVDQLEEIRKLCDTYKLWLHIDGAYGAPVAALPEYKNCFKGMEQANSIALDPHKWLYAPLEAGCILVKNPKHLTDTFSSSPEYYNFYDDQKDSGHNFYEYGMQNSRGFRALKVWLILQQSGRTGLITSIRKDIKLSETFHTLANLHPQLETFTQNLSISTFRFIPHELKDSKEDHLNYLNQLNESLLHHIQHSGELFLSNAIIGGIFTLRLCIVNFRTSEQDIKESIDIITKMGCTLHAKQHSTQDFNT